MLKCLNIFFVLKSSCMHPTPLERSRISIARVHFDILRQCTPLRRRLQAIAHVGQWGYIQLCNKQLVAQEITSAAWPYVYPGIWDLRVPNCPQKETWPYLCNSQVECWQSALQGTDISVLEVVVSLRQAITELIKREHGGWQSLWRVGGSIVKNVRHWCRRTSTTVTGRRRSCREGQKQSV